jgi:guanine deaminase
MTLYRAQVFDTPQNPFRGGELRADVDIGLVVSDGLIVERAPFGELQARYPDDEVVDLREGILLPGLVDTHVHFPQMRAIGALGMPLLEWLEKCALPEEARLADVEYARGVASDFIRALGDSGTTTALVFGSHFATAMDVLFAAAAQRGLRVTSGLVVGDRLLRDDLHTTPERAYAESRALADRWHAQGRLRYAVTPRFSLSCTDELLASCARVHEETPGSWFTSHINENLAEIETVRDLFGGVSYLDSYDRHGLVGRRSVFAHNVHPTDAELKALATSGASVAHCPTSNAALGSGLFPLDRHLQHDVRVALGCDVGAGAGFSLFKEALQAYFVQRLRGPDGVTLTATHLLYLASGAGAEALGLQDEIGDLSAGKRFDAVWVRPVPASTIDVGLRYAVSSDDALAKIFTLATAHDVAGVWVDGARIKR